MQRAELIAGFLARNGFGAAEPVPIAGDAGRRRYFRLVAGPEPALLMDAPPGAESVGDFVLVAARLAGAGLSAPRILAAESACGLVLLEDFGSASLADRLGAMLPQPTDALPEPASRYFTAATETLARLARIDPAGLPDWDGAALTRAAAATFLDWWWPAQFGAAAPAMVREAFTAAMAAMLAGLDPAGFGLTHRDYFAANLFWLPERAGVARIGLIDFQDAARGPAAYDLVSLAEDARRDLPAGLTGQLAARLAAARADLDPAWLAADCARLAAARHVRVAGLWVRLWQRDAKPGYLTHGPRCWAMLDRALAHPATAPLAGFFDRYVQAARRGNPACAPS